MAGETGEGLGQFDTDEAALQYLRSHVLPSEPKDVDLAPLHEKFFEDLGVAPGLVEDFGQVQLGSYHDLVRRRFLNSPENQAPVTEK